MVWYGLLCDFPYRTKGISGVAFLYVHVHCYYCQEYGMVNWCFEGWFHVVFVFENMSMGSGMVSVTEYSDLLFLAFRLSSTVL